MNLLFKFLNYFKPKFYNSITWLVVGTGLSFIGSPLIEQLIQLVFEQFSINITNGDDSKFGLALVVIGLLFHLSTQIIQKNSNSNNNKLIAEHRILISTLREKIDKNEMSPGWFLDSREYQQLEPYISKVFLEKYKKRSITMDLNCLLYTSPSPRDLSTSRMPSSA